jgi:hypothetical protein
MVGEFLELPTQGQVFVILGDSLTEGGTVRIIETSPVIEVLLHGPGWMEFRTENSHYELTYEKMPEEVQ